MCLFLHHKLSHFMFFTMNIFILIYIYICHCGYLRNHYLPFVLVRVRLCERHRQGLKSEYRLGKVPIFLFCDTYSLSSAQRTHTHTLVVVFSFRMLLEMLMFLFFRFNPLLHPPSACWRLLKSYFALLMEHLLASCSTRYIYSTGGSCEIMSIVFTIE